MSLAHRPPAEQIPCLGIRINTVREIRQHIKRFLPVWQRCQIDLDTAADRPCSVLIGGAERLRQPAPLLDRPHGTALSQRRRASGNTRKRQCLTGVPSGWSVPKSACGKDPCIVASTCRSKFVVKTRATSFPRPFADARRGDC